MAARIALIDYGSGNLRSVEKALQRAGAAVQTCREPAGLETCDAVVLPGVGSFGDCARNLREQGLWEPLNAWLREGRPYLGICLGYQILFEGSEECPGERGFGHFAGRVVRFPAAAGLKVPHMGWNDLHYGAPDPMFSALPPEPYVFFVHSYFPRPEDEDMVTAWTDYGVRFAAAAARGRVHGVQFHPEKSQSVGLAMLRGFLEASA